MQMKLFYFFAFSTFFVFINHMIAETEPGVIGKGFCNVDGEIFSVGEEFDIDCDASCVCFGTDMYNCVSRCPPYVPAQGVNCHETENPYDPCCSLTICDSLEEFPFDSPIPIPGYM